MLTELNNIFHNAHDAMGDVDATIEIAKILQKNSNKVWNAGLKNNNKIDVDNFLIQNNIVCMDEYLFGKFNVHAVTYIARINLIILNVLIYYTIHLIILICLLKI